MKLIDLSKEDLESLAKRVGKNPDHLYLIARGHRQAGALLAVALEEQSGGIIKKGDLRPDLWPALKEAP